MKGCKPLSPAEYRRVLDTIAGPMADRDRALFVFGCHTGLRSHELVTLQWSDLLTQRAIASRFYLFRSRTKGQTQGRTVEIPAPAIHALSTWHDAQPPIGPDTRPAHVFTTPAGSPLSTRTIRHLVTSWLRNAAIPPPHGSHTMRKTFAARLYEASGRDLKLCQLALGHTSLASTAHYVEPLAGRYETLIRSLYLG